MPESKSDPATPKEPKIEIKPAKDLEPEEVHSEAVRGGVGLGGKMGGGGVNFSDAALKRHVSPLRDALAKLRDL